MVEAFLEFVFTIIFEPFEQMLNNFLKKSSVVIKVAVYILLIGIIVGIASLINFAINGYWL